MIKERRVLGLERHKELEEFVPMILRAFGPPFHFAIFLSERINITILTALGFPYRHRFSEHRYSLEKVAFIAWQMDDSNAHYPQWIGSLMLLRE